MRFPSLFVTAALVFHMVAPAFAEEKNGLSVEVTKKTLERNDQRSNYYYENRIDRSQGLKVVIKNVSFKEMPAGEVNWTLLVRKYAFTNSVEGSRGKETLKALKPAESVEMVIGAAEIQGWSDSAGQAKDKLEHQVVVTQGGLETMRITSTPAFDSIAKRASFSKK